MAKRKILVLDIESVKKIETQIREEKYRMIMIRKNIP